LDSRRVTSLLDVPAIRELVGRYVPPALRRTLREALKVAYLASLHQNEGRNLRFALAFEREAHRPRQVDLFTHPAELSPKQLQAISAAFAPESTCLVIASPQPEGGSPVIIGTTPRPRGSLSGPQLYQPPVVIDVDAPGVVSLSIGEAKAVFRRGEISEQSRGITGLPLIGETEHLVREVCSPKTHGELGLMPGAQESIPIDPQSWERHGGEIRSIVRRSALRIYDQTLENIARKMLRARRGGALLMVPAGSGAERLFDAGRWYRQPDTQISRDLQRALTFEALFRLARMGRQVFLAPGLDSAAAIMAWGNEKVRPALRASLASLENSCQHCADLTEADGATVLLTDFGIAGFSAKITSHEGVLPPPLGRHLETRGNRHRSMAGAVARQPGAIGLVVSQDGEITVFTHQRGVGPRHLEVVL
jgi:hypothetical protein